MKVRYGLMLVGLLAAVAAHAQLVEISVTSVSDNVIKPGFTTYSGSPYSAERVVKTNQAMRNGKRYRSVEHMFLYRDSQGRTRQEQGVGPNIQGATRLAVATISDPVQLRLIDLDPFSKTATVRHFTTATPRPVKKSGNGTDDTGAGTNASASPPQTEAQQSQVTDQQRHPRVRREDLGTTEIGGITVEGVRDTLTAAPGTFFGNDNELVIVTEVWTSPELREILFFKSDDSRIGHASFFKLVNIQRNEPDPALFRIPAGYMVKDLGY